MKASEVAVLSIGAMGSAMARALLAQGHEVTVWNRSPGKTETLVQLGARQAATVEEALERTQIVLAVPNPYEALREYLLADRVRSLLKEKHVVLMSSYQRLEQPRALQDEIESSGGYFIDGKIFCYPSQIGASGTSLVFSGREEAFSQVREVLAVLGQPIYLGQSIELAFIYECVMTSLFVSTVGGVMNGLALFERAGLPLAAFKPGFSSLSSGLATYLTKVVDNMLPSSDFDTGRHGTATTGGILDVMRHFGGVYEAFGVRPHLCEGIAPVMQALVDGDQGHLDLAAMIRVFQA